MKERIVVLGGGESGTGAAVLAKTKGFDVFVSDYGKIPARYEALLQKYSIDYEDGKHSEPLIFNADIVIKSPGIPSTVPLIQKLLKKGIPVVDEIEWAAQFTNAKLIAITGSNGKTTTTRLIHHILKCAGKKAGLAGNVGYSFARQIAEGDQDYYALEMSSFQLDGAFDLKPDIAVLLNITPDHLNRYDYKLDNYIASKFRIAQNLTEREIFIYNRNDENVKRGLELYHKGRAAQHLTVSMDTIDLTAPLLRVDLGQNTFFEVDKTELTLMGRHNLFNISCAVLVAKQLNIEDDAILKALQTFENEAHRLERVLSINEVEYINDSKATNVDATFFALEAMQKTVVWIVGGEDKGNDYTSLFPLVKEKVRAIVCLGLDNTKIRAAFQDIQPIIEETRSAAEAIKVASLYAEKGDVVLLSPACASFDLFKNYKDRGDQFRGVLLETHKILTEGHKVTINLNLFGNSAQQETDTTQDF